MSSMEVEKVLGNELLLEAILTKLSSRDLARVSSTCKEWNAIADKTLARRKQITRLLYMFQTDGHRRRKAPPPPQNLIEQGIVGQDFFELKTFAQNKVRDLWDAKPGFLLLFHGNFCPHSQKIAELLDYGCLRKYLPGGIPGLSISSSVGLIGSTSSKYEAVELQTEVCPMAGLSYLFFPNMAGCQWQLFEEGDKLTEYYPKPDNSHKKLKCLLMFSNSSADDADGYLSFCEIDRLYEMYGKCLGLGGVVVDDIRPFRCDDQTRTATKRKNMVGVAISGDNVKAASLIINVDAEDMARVLNDFRAGLDFDPDDTKSSRTIGFAFVCSGRGVHIFNQPNQEVGLINKIFPKVKLAGVFGHGEYGDTFIPKSPTIKAGPDAETKFWHFYTTVLVLVNIANV